MKSLLLLMVLSSPVMAESADTQKTTENKRSISDNVEQSSQQSDITENSEPDVRPEQDFKPEQEISEDYPISLPADI